DVASKMKVLAEFIARARVSQLDSSHQEKELAVLKFMAWTAKPQAVREKEALDGISKANGKLEAVRRQQRNLELEILLQESNVRYWTDLLTEARNLPPESPSSDEYGHDRRKAITETSEITLMRKWLEEQMTMQGRAIQQIKKIREESYKQFEHHQRHQLHLAEKLAYDAQRREHDKTLTYQQEISETHVMMEQAESTRRNQREYWEALKAQDAEMQQLKIIMETLSSYVVSNWKCSSFVNIYKPVNASKLLK
ncbi:unnamed protein product, partial [Prorocentrum cordatum]